FHRDLHVTEGLTLAFSFRHYKVPVLPLFGVLTLLVAKHAHRPVAEATETGDDGGIVGESPIPVHLDKIRAQMLYVIQKVRTLRMTRELYLLVRGELIHT